MGVLGSRPDSASRLHCHVDNHKENEGRREMGERTETRGLEWGGEGGGRGREGKNIDAVLLGVRLEEDGFVVVAFGARVFLRSWQGWVRNHVCYYQR